MKTKLGILIAAFALVSFAACKKAKQVIEFDTTLSADHVIPANTLTNNATSLITTNISTGIDSKLSSNNTKSDLIGEVSVKRVNISVKAPSSQDLHFIRDVNVKLRATDQVDAQIGYRWNSGNDTIKPTIKTADLNLNSPNVKNYLMQPNMDVKLNITPNINVSGSMTLTTTFTLHVKGITQ